MKTLIIFTCLMVFPLSFQGQVQAEESVSYHGLADLDLDLWLQGFFNGRPMPKQVNKNVRNQLWQAYNNWTNNPYDSSLLPFYRVILAMKLHIKGQSYSYYKELVDALYGVRKQVRQDDKNPLKSRPASLLLEVLAEELLYAIYKKFPQSPKVWRSTFLGEESTRPCFNFDSTGKKIMRVGNFLNFKLCQGDVVLSKGGSGSSSFIARIPDVPGNFSHATVAYIDPESKKVSFPEAYIEDGVKLRDPQQDYEMAPKKKVFIYRYRPKNMGQDDKVIGQAIRGIDQFVGQMYAKTPDPVHNAVFAYDFHMDADRHDQFFCSEIPFYAYSFSGEVPLENNPYPRPLWSHVSGVRQQLFSDLLSISVSSFPAPSDIEFNTQYDQVGFIINLERLEEDRLDAAIIDALIDFFATNQTAVSRFLDRVQALGAKPMNTRQIETLANLIGVDSSKLEGFKAHVPNNISLKQLIFFGYLNKVFTPKMRVIIGKISTSRMKRPGAIPFGLGALRKKARHLLRVQMERFFEHFETIFNATPAAN